MQCDIRILIFIVIVKSVVDSSNFYPHIICSSAAIKNKGRQVCLNFVEYFRQEKKIRDLFLMHLTFNVCCGVRKGIRISRYKNKCKPPTRYRKGYEEEYRLIELLHRLRCQGIQTLVLKMPHVFKLKNPSKWEKVICNQWVSLISKRFSKKLYPIPGFGEKYRPLLFLDGSLKIDTPFKLKDYPVFPDKHSRYVNVVNHMRPAVDIPNVTVHFIYIVGDSTAIGFNIMDEDTVASFLQKHINEAEKHKKRMVKFTTLICGTFGVSFEIIRRCLLDVRVNEGDVVVVMVGGLRFGLKFEKSCGENGVPYCDLQPDFQRPHNDGEVFYDTAHTNPVGNRKVAKIVYERLFVQPAKPFLPSVFRHFYRGFISALGNNKSNLLQSPTRSDSYGLSTSMEFATFIHGLKAYRDGEFAGVNVGVVVMNCNPFTLGHLYLMETAAVLVDRLFMFVVEEDRSTFPFASRLLLAKAGCMHVPNLLVLASSKFIISSVTLPEYFVKSESPDIKIDASMDLDLFCQSVVPALNVKTRFVGEEPLDRVTRQYNNAMGQTLPRCGAVLQMIPRKVKNGEPISASRVRASLRDSKDYCSIGDIVTQTTFTFIVKFRSKN